MLTEAQSAYRTIAVRPQATGFGAEVTGLVLSRPLDAATLAEVKDAWARHGVLSFPDQPLTIDELEAFTLQIGPFGDDPFVAPMAGHPNVLEIRREPKETRTIFGGAWHSDWSFRARPPSGTLLYSEIIPPVGGDTLFSDNTRAYDALPDEMKARIAPLRAHHTAGFAYGSEGIYAKEEKIRDDGTRAMRIIVSSEADKYQTHPLVRTHAVTGRKSVFASPVYTHGIDGMDEEAGRALLGELYKHMHVPRFTYRHRWRPQMVIIWDNRCCNHQAMGGYHGHRRVMYRTTVAGEAPF